MALVEAAYRSIDEQPRGQALRDSDQRLNTQREEEIMMQAGIFTGYFPYGLEETAQKIRALDFNTVQLDLHFQGHRPHRRPDHHGQGEEECATRFRDHNLPICCVSGYTNIIHPDKSRAQAAGRLSQGDHPQRPRFRLAAT